jgi:transposase
MGSGCHGRRAVMSPAHQSTPLPPELGIPESDWQRTPTTVRDEFLSLLKRVDALESRLNRDSSNSSRPPSTDSAAKKREQRKPITERRKLGAKPGHPGHRQTLLEPTTTVSLFPEPCGCGHAEMTTLIAYQTHQVIELPVIRPEVIHWRLHQGQCGSCGKLRKASLPADQTTGFGPRLTAFVGEMSGVVSISRSAVQSLHAPLALAGGQMGTLTAVVEVATLTMLHPRQNLAFGRPIAFQLVRDD